MIKENPTIFIVVKSFFMAFNNNCSTLNQMLITKEVIYFTNPYIVLICFKILYFKIGIGLQIVVRFFKSGLIW